MKTYTTHHRKPKAQGGTDDPDNLIRVLKSKHEAWSCLFEGTKTPQEIVDEINNVWIDPAYRVALIKR